MARSALLSQCTKYNKELSQLGSRRRIRRKQNVKTTTQNDISDSSSTEIPRWAVEKNGTRFLSLKNRLKHYREYVQKSTTAVPSCSKADPNKSAQRIKEVIEEYIEDDSPFELLPDEELIQSLHNYAQALYLDSSPEMIEKLTPDCLLALGVLVEEDLKVKLQKLNDKPNVHSSNPIVFPVIRCRMPTPIIRASHKRKAAELQEKI
ncbi:hypothetical protein DSO57_1027805 [Entomophthora muscae]|uniref:Uncharacterized protein n=1 Tax=Entomophthora muscae TaxID=34485 RepID=A0ACC2SQQ0_9FUNG|nr:hypothetical protein DSO57_1027805 [Entomophthora muscae]